MKEREVRRPSGVFPLEQSVVRQIGNCFADPLKDTATFIKSMDDVIHMDPIMGGFMDFSSQLAASHGANGMLTYNIAGLMTFNAVYFTTLIRAVPMPDILQRDLDRYLEIVSEFHPLREGGMPATEEGRDHMFRLLCERVLGNDAALITEIERVVLKFMTEHTDNVLTKDHDRILRVGAMSVLGPYKAALGDL